MKNNTEYVECPICNKYFKQLNKHLFYKHTLTIEEFKKQYPLNKLTGQLIKKERHDEGICEVCGKYFKFLKGHLWQKHKEYYIEKYEKTERLEGIECLLCNKMYKNISQHVVETHSLSWENYCELTGYEGPKAYFSDEHKVNLSINKHNFYDNTDRGKEWKVEQSLRSSGDNNPACQPEVRLKISKSRLKNGSTMTDEGRSKASIRGASNINDKNLRGYGYSIRFKYNNVEYHTRSYEEFKVIYTLLENKIEFDYEEKIIKYLDMNSILKGALIDLKIKGDYFEIKGDHRNNIINYYNKPKFNCIKNTLNSLGFRYVIVNYILFCEEFKLIKKLDYEFIHILKNLMNSNELISIQCMSREGMEHKFLKKLDSDFRNNPIIKIDYKKEVVK